MIILLRSVTISDPPIKHVFIDELTHELISKKFGYKISKGKI